MLVRLGPDDGAVASPLLLLFLLLAAIIGLVILPLRSAPRLLKAGFMVVVLPLVPLPLPALAIELLTPMVAVAAPVPAEPSLGRRGLLVPLFPALLC